MPQQALMQSISILPVSPSLAPGFLHQLTIRQSHKHKQSAVIILICYPRLKKYVGNVSAPIFPGIYAVYNTGNLSFSAGFNPIGGGGGAVYKTGLPSFEMNIADIPPSLTAQGIPTTQYSSDIYFKGSSVYFGYQANVGYKISDKFSVAVGARLVTAQTNIAAI
jgi:hypothetical protein